MSAIRVQELPDSTTEIYSTLKTHKRYSLRVTALAAILIGSILNFTSFVVACVGYPRAPRYLTVWASIVLGISFLWDCVDLLSHSDRIFHPKQFISLNALVFMDTLGFLSFLALLIANGIIMHDIYHTTILYAYNSVPWMFCCAVHLVIALQSVYGVIINIGYGSTCCPDCGRKAKNESRKSGGVASRPLLGDTGEYEDIEANENGQ